MLPARFFVRGSAHRRLRLIKLPRMKTPDPVPLALVLLHFFGSSQREWQHVIPDFSARRRCIALDMPGFGDAAALGAMSVAAMADFVDSQILQQGVGPCVVVGHSMSGKVAAVLASRAPSYLHGLVLVTPSPPSPEPMSVDARAQLLAFDGSRAAAQTYIDGVTAQRLAGPWRESAITDAMRASLPAWKAWIEHGSQEDWSQRVGLLRLPALVIAGAEDASLGADVQRQSTLPHLLKGSLAIIAGGHALPLENPAGLRAQIEHFVASLD